MPYGVALGAAALVCATSGIFRCSVHLVPSHQRLAPDFAGSVYQPAGSVLVGDSIVMVCPRKMPRKSRDFPLSRDYWRHLTPARPSSSAHRLGGSRSGVENLFRVLVALGEVE